MNNNISNHLRLISFLYTCINDRWRSEAFSKASQTINKLTYELNYKNIYDIPNVGVSIQTEIYKYLKNKNSKRLEELAKKAGLDIKVLKKLITLTDIPKIGIKTAIKIYDTYNITSIKQLKNALKKGKIGGKLANTLEGNLRFAENKEMPWFKALLISEAILKKLEKLGRIEVAGSIRRRSCVVKDFDFVSSIPLYLIIKNFLGCKFKTEQWPIYVVDCQVGDKKVTFDLKIDNSEYRKMDVIATRDDSFGTYINYLTGSKPFNLNLRKQALQLGYSLNQHYITKKSTSKKIKITDEREIFNILGIDFIPPECRMDGSEINDSRFSEKNLIPDNKRSIFGDLHVHSNMSDGVYDIASIVNLAKKEKYSFIGISDHSESSKGISNTDIPKYVKKIKNIGNSLNFPVYAGLELDIKSDGELDCPVKFLKYLDYVIVSFHRGNKNRISYKLMKVITEIKTAYPNFPIIVGHLTGRKICKRPGADKEDWSNFFDFCYKNSIILEINSSPSRLDIPAVLIRKAVGCKFVINTDFHKGGLKDNTINGIIEARKGGLRKSDILNTNFKKIQKIMER